MPNSDEWRSLLIGYIAVGLPAILACGGLLIWKGLTRTRLFPMQRLRKGAWSGWDVFWAFAILALTPMVVQQALEFVQFFPKLFGGEAPSTRKALWSGPLINLIALALILSTLYARSGTHYAHVGVTHVNCRGNLLLGGLGFLVCTPVILGIFWLALLVSGPADDHPLQEAAKLSLWPMEWILWGLQPLILAPILEEVVFRGLLQGWLRRASLAGHGAILLGTLLIGMDPSFRVAEGDWNFIPAPAVFTGLLCAAYAALVYMVWKPVLRQGSRFFTEEGTDSSLEPTVNEEQPRPINSRRWRSWLKTNAYLSIFGSAMLFAVVHSRVWPSPIPLFFFGLALGWMTYRTQSLIAAIACHGLFNAVACIHLVLSLQS